MEHFDWLKGFVLPYLNFLIFAAILFFAARKPLARYAKQRREDFLSQSAEAQRLVDEARAQNQELQQRLAKIDAELNKIRENAKRAAEEESRHIIQDAEDLAANIREEAKRVADAELAKAKRGLKEDIIAQVSRSVETKLKSELDAGKQKELLQRNLKQVSQLDMGGAR